MVRIIQDRKNNNNGRSVPYVLLVRKVFTLSGILCRQFLNFSVSEFSNGTVQTSITFFSLLFGCFFLSVKINKMNNKPSYTSLTSSLCTRMCSCYLIYLSLRVTFKDCDSQGTSSQLLPKPSPTLLYLPST